MSTTPKRCVQCGILKDPFEFRRYTYSKTAGTQGRYRICKECEALNTRYRRAIERGDAEEFELINKLYLALEALGYRTPLRSGTRQVPSETADLVDRLMKHHSMDVSSVVKRTPIEPTETAIVELHHDNGVIRMEVPKKPKQRVTSRPWQEGVPGVEVLSWEEDDSVDDKTEDASADVPHELQYWLDVDALEWADNDISPEYLQETIYESLKAKYRPQIGIDKELYLPIYDDTYRDVLNAILRRFDEYEETYIDLSGPEPIELTRPPTLEGLATAEFKACICVGWHGEPDRELRKAINKAIYDSIKDKATVEHIVSCYNVIDGRTPPEVYACPVHFYKVRHNPDKLTNDELALICDKGSLEFGYVIDHKGQFNIFRDIDGYNTKAWMTADDAEDVDNAEDEDEDNGEAEDDEGDNNEGAEDNGGCD